MIVHLLSLLAWAGAPLPAADGSALNGIAHAALRVGDVAKSREFYRTLGWEQAFAFSDDQGIATSYVKVNDRQFIELYRRNAPAETLGLMHICLEAADLDAVLAAYQKAGLVPASRRKARAGNLLFNLTDPEGQLIEYTQYLPGSLHTNENGKHVLEARLSSHLVRVSLPVKSMAVETAFFTGKLGFSDLGNGRVGAPGTSGEQIQLEPTAAEWKPRLAFEVADVKRTAEELKKRGVPMEVTTEVTAGAALVRDPDGTVILFAAR